MKSDQPHKRGSRRSILNSVTARGTERFFSLAELEQIRREQRISLSEAAAYLGISPAALERLTQENEKANAAHHHTQTHHTGAAHTEAYRQFLAERAAYHAVLGNGEDSSFSGSGQGSHSGYFPTFRQILIAGIIFISVFFFLIVATLSYFFFTFPEQTALLLGYTPTSIEHSPVPRTKTGKDVLGATDSRVPEQKKLSLPARLLRPFTLLPLTFVKHFDEEKYYRIVPEKRPLSASDIFSVTEQGEMIPRLTITFPSKAFSNRDNFLQQMNVTSVLGRSPGSQIGDLVVRGDGGTIEGLAVLNTNLTQGSVVGGKGGIIADGSLTSADIADGAVITALLASGSVTSEKIADGTIQALDIADSSISNSKLETSSVSVNAGNGLTGGGTVSLGSATALALDITTTSSSVTISSNSGLEVSSDGLRLLGGCSDGQVLQWNSVSAVWECGNAAGGGGSLSLEEGNSEIDGTVTSIDFLGSDFDLSESPENEVNIQLAATLTSVTGVAGDFMVTGGDLVVGSSAVLSDAAGTLTLTNVDILDATTETTVENAIDSLGNLTSAASLTTVGTLTGGATGAGFMINLGTSTLSGSIGGSNIDESTLSGLTTGNFSSGNISQWTNNAGYLTTVDISSNTNLSASNGVTLTGDAVSLSSTAGGDGLTYTAGVLAVGVGTGISIAADSISTTLGTTIDTSEVDSNTLTLLDIADTLTLDNNLTLSSGDATNDYKVVIDNASTGDIASLLQITTTGVGATIATAVDLSDIDIGVALALGANDITVGGITLTSTELSLLDSGITLSELTDSGTLTAGTVDINGGAIDGVTIGGSSAGAGTFTNLTANGATVLGDAATDAITLTGEVRGANALRFEGLTDDDIYTIFAIPDAVTGSKTITFPSGNVTLNAAGDITGTTLASNVVTSSLTTVGTLTGGATGSGFTVNFGTSTLSGNVTGANISSLDISDDTNLSASDGITLTGDALTNSDKGSSQNIFKTIAVSGQSNVVSDLNGDTLTFIAGTNVTLTTDATNDTLTINATDTNTTYSAGNDLDLTGSTFALETTLDFVDTINLTGTGTLNGLDAIDATTESTIEGAIDTLGNLTSASSLVTVGTLTGGATGAGFTLNFGTSTLSGDVTGANISGLDISSDTNLSASSGVTLTGDALSLSSTAGGDGLTYTTGVLAVGQGIGISVTADSISATLGTSIANSEIDNDTIDLDKVADTLVLDADLSFTAAAGQDITLNKAFTDATGENAATLNVTASDTTTGTTSQFGLYLDNLASSEGVDGLLILDNSDVDDAVGAAIKIINAGGGFTTIIDNAGTLISGAELNLLDAHDAALVDTNDGVATAITGTGTLTAGTTGAGFTINFGTSTLSGDVTGANVSGLDISGDTNLSASDGITLTGDALTNSDKGSSQLIFKTISVSGQSDVVTDANADTLTLIAGTNVTLTTNATNDSVTFTAVDTNTTYTAGNDLDLTGTTFDLESTLDIVDTINLAGTGTLNGLDAIDATTESTIEGAIDTLGNLTSASSLVTVGTLTGGATGAGFTINFGTSTLSGDVTGANVSGLDISGDTNLSASDGITLTGDALSLSSTAGGDGLTYTTGVLAVGAGTGISVAADSISATLGTSIANTEIDNDTIDLDKVVDTLSLDADLTFTAEAGEDITLNKTFTDATSENGTVLNFTGSDTTSGTASQFGLYLDNLSSTEGVDSLLVLDNSDADDAVSAAIKVVNAGGGFTTLIDNAGTLISGAELNLLDGKTTLVDTDDVVGTAITGTGTLTSGATGAGFTINFGTSTLSGSVTGTNISGLDISDDTNLSASNGVTLTGDALSLSSTAGGDGLTYTTGVLAVGAGTGISVAADSISATLGTSIANTELDTNTIDLDKVADTLSLDADLVFTLGGGEDITFNKTFTNNTSENGFLLNATASDTGSGTTAQYGMYIDNLASTEGLDAALVIDNSDADDAIGAAFKTIDAGGGFTNLFDIAGTLISSGEFTVLDAGIALSELTDSGTLTAGTVDINGGAIDGTTLGASSRSTAAVTTFDANGTVQLGDGGDAVTINGSSLGLQTTGAGSDITLNAVDQIILTDFANCTALETSSGVLTCGTDDGGAGSQTPWLADIDGDGYDLTDLSNLEFRETTGAPAGTVVGLYRDNSGDLSANVLTGKTFNIAVNGTDEYNFSSSAFSLNSNSLSTGSTTLTTAELDLLDAHDVALIDTNDAVATAITGTGTLTAGATGAGFTLNFGTSTLSGDVTGSNISSLDISDDTNLSASNGVTLTGDALSLSSTAGGDGLTYTTGVLAVGAGTGISVAADSISATLGTSIANSELDANTIDFDKFTDSSSLDTDWAIAAGAGEDLTLNKAFTDNTTESGVILNFTASDTGSGTTGQYGVYLDNLASTEGVDALLVLDNSDADDAVGAAIKTINAGGGFTNLFDISGTLISATEFTILDSGIALSELTDSGTFTAGTVDINGGAMDGVTIGGSSAAGGTFTTLATTGVTTIGNNSATVAINSNDWDIDATGAILGVAFDANGSGNSITNIDNADLTNDTLDLDKLADTLALDGDLAFTAEAGEDLTINKTFTNNTTENGVMFNFTASDTGSGTTGQYGLYLDNLASTEGLDASLVIDNSDADDAVTAAIKIINAGGGFTSLFDVEGTLISSTEFTLLDSGIALSELTDSGTLTVTTVDINGGAIDGVTIGGSSAGAGTFTTLTTTGITALGNNSATVAINSNDWDIDATGAITGVAFDANGTGNSISNIDNADLTDDTLDLDKLLDSLSLDADLTLTAGAGEDLTFAKTYTNNTGENGLIFNFTASDTGAATTAQYGMTINNLASTEGLDALMVLDNADADDSVGDAIRITSAAGTILTGLDFDDTDIVTDIELQNGETIDNNTDDLIVFTGAGGGANVAFTIDLDDTHAVLSSSTTTLDVDDILNANSITSDAGVSIASGQSYTGAGAVTLSSGGGAGLTLESASGRVSVNTGDFLNISVAGVTNAAAGDIWYDSTAQKYKINENGTTKTLCNTTDADCGNAKMETFTGNGTYTMPADARVVIVQAVGGGGSGGGGGRTTAASGGGGGGGGGAYTTKSFNSGDITSPVTVTVGAIQSTVGTGRTGSSGAGTAGTAGNNSSFPANASFTLTAYGGGGGSAGPQATGNTSGGGGGGTGGAGAAGSAGAAAAGGLPVGVTTDIAVGGEGGAGISGAAGGRAEYGGAGGGGSRAGAGFAGGASLFGGGGGGGGSGGASSVGGAGGQSGAYSTAGGGTAGSANNSPTGVGGTGATGSSSLSGAGGGGGGVATGAGSAGGDGGAMGGGGGGGSGGGATGQNGGNGGQGARGEVRVWTVRGVNADVAEVYGTFDDSMQAGDVVSLDPTMKAGVRKAQGAYDQRVMGVYSTAPAMIIGSVEDSGARAVSIALSGRVPVKVSTENGSIKPGDYLTASSLPGIAMKATKAGQVIGQAMGAYDGGGLGYGVVVLFVNNGYYNGQSIQDHYEVAINNTISSSQAVLGAMVRNINSTEASSSAYASEIVTDRLAAGVEVITPRLVADEIVARSIKAERIEGLEIMVGHMSKLDADIKTLQDLLASSLTIEGSEATVAGVASPSAESTSGEETIFGSATIKGMLSVLEGMTSPNLLITDWAEFFGKVFIRNDLSISGKVTLGQDSTGVAVLKQGRDQVSVTFAKAYESVPLVIASISLDAGSDEAAQELLENTVLKGDIHYVVTRRSKDGFVIRLSKPTTVDLPFTWTAVAGNTTKTVSPIPSTNENDLQGESNTPSVTVVPTPTAQVTPLPTQTPTPTLPEGLTPVPTLSP